MRGYNQVGSQIGSLHKWENMDFMTAVGLLGLGEPWHLVPKEDFEGYQSNRPDPGYPWFAMNRQETIQFRVLGNTIDAVILRPEELTDYERLDEVLAANGFQPQMAAHPRPPALPPEDAFVHEKATVRVPRTQDRSPGFACAVMIERRRT